MICSDRFEIERRVNRLLGRQQDKWRQFHSHHMQYSWDSVKLTRKISHDYRIIAQFRSYISGSCRNRAGDSEGTGGMTGKVSVMTVLWVLWRYCRCKWRISLPYTTQTLKLPWRAVCWNVTPCSQVHGYQQRLHWRWRQNVPLKRWYLCTKINGVTSLNTVMLISILAT